MYSKLLASAHKRLSVYRWVLLLPEQQLKDKIFQKLTEKPPILFLKKVNKQWKLLRFLNPTIMDREGKGSFRCQNVVDD